MSIKPEELKIKCTLGVIKAPDGGTVGSVAARAFRQPDPANLVPQTMYSRQRYMFYSQHVVSVAQASGMLNGPVNRYIGAPLATFMVGGITSEATHPQLSLIKGPPVNVSDTFYKTTKPVIASYNIPGYSSTANFGTPLGTGAAAPATADLSTNNNVPSYPTIPATINPIYPGAGVLETYNIWNIVDVDTSQYTFVQFAGPECNATYTGARTRQVAASDGTMAIQVFAQNSSIRLQRMFPLAYDLMYSNPRQTPSLYYPPVVGANDVPPYTSVGNRPITLLGGDNCGFQLHFMASAFGNPTNNQSVKSAGITITWGVPVGQVNPPSNLSTAADADHAVQTFRLHIPANGHATLECIYPKNKKSGTFSMFEIKSPEAFRTGGDYHVYVHYVGPFMLIGFDDNPDGWNCIHTLGLDQNNFGQYYYPCVPADATMEIAFSYVTATFQYGPIAFNNFTPENINTSTAKADFANKNDLSYVNTTMVLPGRLGSYVSAGDTIIPSASSIISSSMNTTFQSQSYCSPSLNDKWYTDTINPTPSQKVQYRNQPTYYEDWRYRQSPHMYYQETNRTTQESNGDVLITGKIVFDNTVGSPLFLNFTYHGINTTPNGYIQPLTGWSDSACDISEYMSDVTILYQLENDLRNVLSGTCHLTLLNMMNTINGRNVVSVAEQNILAVTIQAGYNDIYNTFFQGILKDIETEYLLDGSSKTIMNFIDVATGILGTEYFTALIQFENTRYGDIVAGCVRNSSLGPWYKQEWDDINLTSISNSDYRYGFLYTLNQLLGYFPLACSMAQDLMFCNPSEIIGKKIVDVLNMCVYHNGLPVLWWNPNATSDGITGFLQLDSRTDPATVDSLYFAGAPGANGVVLLPNTATVDHLDELHGVLSTSYKTMHHVEQLHAGLTLFGMGSDNNQLDVSFPDANAPLAYSDAAYAAIQGAITPSGVNSNIDGSANNGYVGHRKILVVNHYSPLLTDYKALHMFGNEVYTYYLRQVYHTITFSCYVTKPLNHQGQFNISTFDSSVQGTDNFLYSTVSYHMDKNKNIIEATVSGETFPAIINGYPSSIPSREAVL